MRSSYRAHALTSLLPLLLLSLASAACGGGDVAEPEQGALALRLDYLEEEGCAERPAGTGLPSGVTLVEVTLFEADSQEQVQALSVLVDPLARCSDGAGNEFSCPFDADGDGLRERFVAFEPIDVALQVVVVVSLKDQLSTVLWSGHSEPFRLSDQGARPVSVALNPSEDLCQ